MFAVIKTGGKQYRVSPKDVIKVERRDDAKAGETFELTDVLALGNEGDVTIGTPNVDGARVLVSVLENKRDDKVIVFKKKRRKNYRRTRGHRQYISILRVEEILEAGQKASKKKPDEVKKAPAKKAPAKKAPAKKAES